MNNNKKLNIRSEVENWAKVKFSQINFQDENIDQKHLEEISGILQDQNHLQVFIL